MSARLPRRLLLLVVVGLLAGAAPASAATVVARGNDPDAAVDRDGVTHLVWNESRPETGPADVLHYCQIPRGGSTCTNEITRTPPAIGGSEDSADTEGPNVMITPFGEVILLTTRNFVNVAYISDDGGATFPDEPVEIGTIGGSFTGGAGRAVFDGADRRVVTIDGPTQGIRLQGAPIAAAGNAQARTTAYAALTDYSAYDPSVVQRGRGSFVAAWSDLGGTTYVRTFNCTAGPPTCPTADLNDASKWSPQVPVADAELPELVSGPSGTFLTYRSTAQGPTYRQYMIRRVDGTTIGPPSPVSEAAVGSGARDVIEDQSGVVHALYVGADNSVSYRASADGATFGGAQVLQPGPDFTLGALRVAARSVDGGFAGFGFWESQDGGQQNPPILGAALPDPSVSLPRPPTPPPGDPGTPGAPGAPVTPPAPGTPAAVPQPPAACRVLSFAAVDVIADACLTRDGDAYVASGGVLVNGLRVELGSGKLRLEPRARRITSSGATVTVKAGDTTLLKQPVDWTLPSGSVADIGTFDVGAAGGDLLGFPLKGTAKLRFRGGGAEMPIHLGLPALFGGTTGDVTLRADNLAGVHLRELHVKVGDALIGPLEIKDLFFDYDADAVSWAGGAELILPPQPPGPSLKSSVGFTRGELDFFKGDLTLPGPGLPVDPTGIVYLKKIRFSLQATPPPLKLTGGVTMTAGPMIAGAAAVGIDGDVSYTFPSAPAPAILRVDGRVSLVSIPLATAFFELRTNGYVAFGGHVGYEQSGFKAIADVNGVLYGTAFNVKAGASVCLGDLGCAGGDVVVSSTGFAGCVKTFVADFGAGYKWGDSLDIMFTGCDVGPYETRGLPRGEAAQAGGARTVRFADGLPSGFVAVQGQGAPPHVSLVGPDGTRIDAPVTGKAQTDRALAFHVPETNTTYFAVKSPAAGVWSVEPAADSVPITQLRSAAGLEQPKVRARVTRGPGRTRVLTYEVNRVPGQRVTFAEDGAGAAGALGVARAGRGKLRFTPADGPGGSRKIVALVSSYGSPRTKLDVATYVAPPPARPATVKRLTAARRGSRLAISWRPAANARRYEARVTLSDGRRLLFLQRGTRLSIPAVAARTRATITVRGVKGDTTRGAPATRRVAAKRSR